MSPGRGSFSSSSSSEAAAAAADQLEEDLSQDTVEELLVKAESIKGLMKMERRSDAEGEGVRRGSRWFPYLDAYRARTGPVTSREVVEVVEPYIMESRKERMKKVVGGRSYSICLVIEGLTDLGNVSAAFRSADALGIQSVHVISNVKSRRCSCEVKSLVGVLSPPSVFLISGSGRESGHLSPLFFSDDRSIA